MTKKIAWITDTAAFIPQDIIKLHNIHVLLANLIFEDGAYRETLDLTQEQFYEKLRTTKSHPKTSQPTFGDQIELYERLKKEGYDCAIAVHVSAKQSGIYNCGIMASQQAGFQAYVIDSRIGSYPIQKMIEHGIALEKQGLSPEEIVKEIEEMRDRTQLAIVPANLEQLYKSGRVKGVAMLLSNLLNIKLVIAYNKEGFTDVFQKVRAEKKARKVLTDMLDSSLKISGVDEVAILQANCIPRAEEWKKELEEMYPLIRFIIMEVSMSAGLHTGEGTMGLSWVRNK